MPDTLNTYPPCCVSCGTAISHVAGVYMRIKNKRSVNNIEKKGLRSKDLASYTKDIAMGDVLDKLGITNMCCRVAVMTHKI